MNSQKKYPKFDKPIEDQLPENDVMIKLATTNTFFDIMDEGVEIGRFSAAFVSLVYKAFKKRIDEGLKKHKSLTHDQLIENDFTFGKYKLSKRNGAKYYDFSNCPDILQKEKELANLKPKHKAAIDGIDKNTQLIQDDNMIPCWIDSDGEIKHLGVLKYRSDSLILEKKDENQ